MKKHEVDAMTVQQACDYAVTKIVEQGGQCGYERDGGGFVCLYGGKQASGKHCGIGWLLDENDEELMGFPANVAVLSSSQSVSHRVPELIKNHTRLFLSLQLFHDFGDALLREDAKHSLHILGIDTTTNPAWEQWVSMGR